VKAALDVVSGFRDRPAGTLRLNVPVSAARLMLPTILPGFLAAYPDIRMEIVAEDSFVDVLVRLCIRYHERLEPDMIAVPIGPRLQCFTTAAAPRRPISNDAVARTSDRRRSHRFDGDPGGRRAQDVERRSSQDDQPRSAR
jgi:DNA-binding transcriptional LysR family regulator